MPIYMDLHIIPGIKANEIAEAHRRDLLVQDTHECTCMTYWIDEKRGTVFCLIDAPDKKAVEDLHFQAHGMIPHQIIEVNPQLVDSFLGRIHDPETATISADGLKVFDDSSFRVLLITQITDPVFIEHALGKEYSNRLLSRYTNLVRKELADFGGSEVEQVGYGFVISFISAAKAMACAAAVLEKLSPSDVERIGLKIGIHGGEPVSESAHLFGNTIVLAKRLCQINRNGVLAISTTIKELITKDTLRQETPVFCLPAQEEEWLGELFRHLEDHWADLAFNGEDYCKVMTMSSSQFYRKTIAVTGLSPNTLLKDFRLEKAKQLIRNRKHSITEIAFEAGFSSPSYFTKCFKKKYGLLPAAYLELSQ